MILTVTPNPCVDKTVFIDELKPGSVMRARHYTCIAGGKGTNVARAAHVMGGTVKALVVVGGHTGQHVVDMIEADGVDCIPVVVDSATRTITTVLEERTHRQTAFFEPGSLITPSDLERIVEEFTYAVKDARVVIFCGTVSDPSIADLYATLIPIARTKGVKIYLDSHGREFARGLETDPNLIKPNVAEAEELLGTTIQTGADRWNAIDKLHEFGVDTVVLSLGKDGALVSEGRTRLHVKPPEIDEVNAVGSGDALLAGFALGFVRGDSLESMARLGVAMGAANAMTWDIGHFTKAEVESLLSRVTVERHD